MPLAKKKKQTEAFQVLRINLERKELCSALIVSKKFFLCWFEGQYTWISWKISSVSSIRKREKICGNCPMKRVYWEPGTEGSEQLSEKNPENVLDPLPTDFQIKNKFSKHRSQPWLLEGRNLCHKAFEGINATQDPAFYASTNKTSINKLANLSKLSKQNIVLLLLPWFP